MKIDTSKQVTTVNPSSRSHLRLGFVLIALALACLALSSTAQAQCSPDTLKGTYMSLTQSGTLNDVPIAEVNRLVADGMGGISGSGTVVVNGVASSVDITATYTVNSDCTGTLTSVPAGLSENFVIRDNGTQVFFIVTAHAAGSATIAGEAVRVSRSSH
jgi:hypothetical protein